MDSWLGQAQNAFQIEKWNSTHLARGNGGRCSSLHMGLIAGYQEGSLDPWTGN